MTAPIVRTPASPGLVRPRPGHLSFRGGWPGPLLGLTVLLLAACSDSSTDPDPSPGDPVPTRIALSTDEVLLSFVGVSETVTATVLDQDGDPMPGEGVTWSSVDDAVATVSTAGVVTSTGVGTTRVTARSGELTASADVDIRTDWIDVAAGALHACGLWGHGVAFCWGDNADGRLGIGALDPGSSSVPLAVAADVLFESLGAGDGHTCGLTTGGEVLCWGTSRVGQLGTGDDTNRDSPTPVDSDDRFTALTVGSVHACALREGDRRAYCWGGGLGSPLQGRDVAVGYTPPDACTAGSPYSSRCSLVPRAVQGGLAFDAISAGLSHTCAIASGGIAYCWGWNEGQLGNGEIHEQSPGSTPAGYASPQAVGGWLSIADISAGTIHTCAADVLEVGYCWGGSAQPNTGMLGNGDLGARALPTEVNVVRPWASMAAALQNSVYNGYSCGLDTDGLAWCWGSNRKRQLGSAAFETCSVGIGLIPCALSPQEVSGDRVFDRLSPGLEFTCGLADDRTAWCWGTNEDGQLGDGTTTDRIVPARVVDPDPPSA